MNVRNHNQKAMKEVMSHEFELPPAGTIVMIHDMWTEIDNVVCEVVSVSGDLLYQSLRVSPVVAKSGRPKYYMPHATKIEVLWPAGE